MTRNSNRSQQGSELPTGIGFHNKVVNPTTQVRVTHGSNSKSRYFHNTGPNCRNRGRESQAWIRAPAGISSATGSLEPRIHPPLGTFPAQVARPAWVRVATTRVGTAARPEHGGGEGRRWGPSPPQRSRVQARIDSPRRPAAGGRTERRGEAAWPLPVGLVFGKVRGVSP